MPLFLKLNLKIIHRYACFDELDNLQRLILNLFQYYAKYRAGYLLREGYQSINNAAHLHNQKLDKHFL